MKKSFLCLLIVGLLACEGPEPRKPVKVKSGSFIRESIERNKRLLAAEEAMIKAIIAQDSLHTYFPTADGSWYFYSHKNNEVAPNPQTDDLVTFTYNVLTFANDTLYTEEEKGIVTYKVDKQELFPGLQKAIKLLKEGEQATFLFPSSMAYGYPGDKNKIGVNVPVKTNIHILKITPKKEVNTP